MTKHILIVSSELFSLINFRSSLIKHLVKKGHKVTALYPKEKNDIENLTQELRDIGVIFKSYYLSRVGLNPIKDYLSYRSISYIIKEYMPNIIIAYTAKPVIYVGMAIRNFPKIRFFPLVTGLGYGFIEGDEIKRKLIKKLMIFLYKIGLKKAFSIIFQNFDDRKLFYDLEIISKNTSTHIINGSGVDLKLFPYTPLPKKPIFLMLARLLIDKGVREYAEAARIIKAQFPNAIFQLAGRLDSNPSSINSKELEYWIKEGYINYLGEISSVQEIVAQCKFYVLPSYREGTPRSVLEALATGRPVITTDTPGCRETVSHEKNGLLIPPKNYLLLANAMIELLNKPDHKIQNMAKESYIMAKDKFDVEKVNKDILDILNI